MIYLIDAYNYIAYVTGHKTSSARHIKTIVRDIERALKGHADTALIVFDGGVLPHQETATVGSCTLIYPGTGHTADEYLLDELARSPVGQVCLVTADREIIAGARRYHHSVMKPHDFHQFVQEKIAVPASRPAPRSGIIKYSDYQAAPEVDAIMQEAARGSIPDKDSDHDNER